MIVDGQVTYDRILQLLADGEWHNEDELEALANFPREWIKELEASGRHVTTTEKGRLTTVDSFSSGFRMLVPEDCGGDQRRDVHESNLRDVHRRYAEVTTSREVIAYLKQLRQPAYV